MKRETIQCLKLGAADVTNGINAKIAAVSLDGVDARPTPVTVYNDIDHPWVRRRHINAEDTDVMFPAFVIFQHAPIQVIDTEVRTIVRDAYITACLAVVLKGNNEVAMSSDGQYVARATLQFLHWFMRNDQTSGFRTRNGIIIRQLVELTQDDVEIKWGGATCFAPTIAKFRVRETQP